MICPRCGIENSDNWPIRVDGKIKDGGCQDCWESECDRTWWNTVIAIGRYGYYLDK